MTRYGTVNETLIHRYVYMSKHLQALNIKLVAKLNITQMVYSDIINKPVNKKMNFFDDIKKCSLNINLIKQ